MAELSERIGGEVVTLRVDIGVIEAVAKVEDELFMALARLQRGSYKLARAAVIAGAKAAGREGDLQAWFDEIAPGRTVALAALAYRALAEALNEGAASAKKAEAAEMTTEQPAS